MATNSRPRALVIDDDPAVAAVLARMLEPLGRSVDAAASAEEGLAALGSGDYSLVLLDVELPGMTGFQALERIGEVSPAPVVLMSGHADEEFRKDALLLGAKALLRKPFSFEELSACLGAL